MSTSASATSANRKESAARTVAQSFCLIVGATLVAVGVLGFIFAGTDFNTGSGIQGEEFIVFEVNGWHNIVHIATGALLLFAAPKAEMAAPVALVFGLTYLVVTAWGFVDGDDVVNVIPVNTADNILHLVLAIAAIGAALASGGLAASAKREHPAT